MADESSMTPAGNGGAPRWRMGVMAQQAAVQARLREAISADEEAGEVL